jgi:two-component system, NarL family, invasion response regulator UvrY
VAEVPVPVLVVDDQPPFRMAASAVVRATPGFDVVGEAASGEGAIEQVDLRVPGLVLMDINMEGIGGIEATRRITVAHPDTKVVLMSTYDADDLPADARTCGAIAYVNKEDFGPDALLRVWSSGDGV